MKNMKALTMYECQHCKKLFKTPNKHICRRDTAKTNCYSCEHWLHQFYIDWSGEREPSCSPEQACNMHETSVVESAHGLMMENGWYLECSEYKQKE